MTVHPRTPDGRYFVVRGRLWRLSNPELAEDVRQELVRELMQARSALRGSDPTARPAIRAKINQTKIALGERGPVWWDDDAPDYNRHLAKNTPYSDWWARQNA